MTVPRPAAAALAALVAAIAWATLELHHTRGRLHAAKAARATLAARLDQQERKLELLRQHVGSLSRLTITLADGQLVQGRAVELLLKRTHGRNHRRTYIQRTSRTLASTSHQPPRPDRARTPATPARAMHRTTSTGTAASTH